jgi:hypothetical protein
MVDGVLVCAQCDAISPPGAHGWQALLGYDSLEDESPRLSRSARSARSGSSEPEAYPALGE